MAIKSKPKSAAGSSKKVARRMSTGSTPRRQNTGVIRPDELYTFEEATHRMNQGRQTIRNAFREGLPYIFFGKCKYILGSDLIDFLKAKRKRS